MPYRHGGAHYWKKHFASFSRWLHIYLSMVSFGILFFFAVTGLTLNHPDWLFGDKVSTRHEKGRMDVTWLQAPDATVRRLEIVEQLRRAHRIHGAVGEFRLEDRQCAITFKGPGYSADVVINRVGGDYELTETRLGFVAVINDLHKGRDSGHGWSVIIDVSAILMTLVSLSGMILIFFIKRRRVSGLIAALVGAVVCYLAYALMVP